jgi:hypothetical protein
VVLGAYVPPDLYQTPWRGLSLRLLAGADEYFVHDGSWTRGTTALQRKGANIAADTIPGANHFFLATHPAETGVWLERVLSNRQKTQAPR